MAGSFLELAVHLIIGGSGDFVGCHDRDAVVEEILVESGDSVAGGAVHEHGVEDVHSDYFLLEFVGIDVLAGFQQTPPVPADVDSGAVEHGLGAAGYAHNVDLEVALLHQGFALPGNLLYELASHGAYSAEEDVELLILGEEEAVVDDVQGLAQVLAVYDEGNVGLRRSLGAGDYADAAPSQGGEELAGNARMMSHVFTYHRHCRKGTVAFHRGYGPGADFLAESLVKHLTGTFGVLLADAYGYTGFGGCLAHQEGGNAL